MIRNHTNLTVGIDMGDSKKKVIKWFEEKVWKISWELIGALDYEVSADVIEFNLEESPESLK